MTLKRVLLSLLVLGALGAGGWNLSRDYGFDLDTVVVAGNISPVQRNEVYGYLMDHRADAKSLDEIKNILDAIDWVHHVEVARYWPDRLLVTVHQEQAIAYWNDDAFINDEGIVFQSEYLSPGTIAQLYGPKDTEREVMQQYFELSKALTRDGQNIDTLTLDERGSWEFTTHDGIKVLLGKDDIMERIQSFLLVVDSESLEERLDNIEQIDTRYSNGLAVSWKEASLSLEIARTDKSQRESRL